MRYNNNSEKLRNGICIVLSFILSLLLTCSFIFFILNSTVLNSNYLKQQLKESNFVQYKVTQLEDVFVSLGLASNFSEDFMVTVLDKQVIEQDLDNLVSSMYHGETYAIDEDSMKQDFYNKFVQNATERGFQITQENEQAINYLADECVDAYKKEFSFSGINILITYLPIFAKYSDLAFLFVVVLALITLIFIFVLNLRKYNALKYLDYSIITTFLSLSIPTIIVIASGKIQKLGILNEGLYKFATSYLTNLFNQILFISIFLLLISIIIYLVYFILRKSYIKKLR